MFVIWVNWPFHFWFLIIAFSSGSLPAYKSAGTGCANGAEKVAGQHLWSCAAQSKVCAQRNQIVVNSVHARPQQKTRKQDYLLETHHCANVQMFAWDSLVEWMKEKRPSVQSPVVRPAVSPTSDTVSHIYVTSRTPLSPQWLSENSGRIRKKNPDREKKVFSEISALWP